MSVTPQEDFQEFLDDDNGNLASGAHEEEDKDALPQDLSLGDLDITSSDVSLKGEAPCLCCLQHLSCLFLLLASTCGSRPFSCWHHLAGQVAPYVIL